MRFDTENEFRHGSPTRVLAYADAPSGFNAWCLYLFDETNGNNFAHTVGLYNRTHRYLSRHLSMGLIVKFESLEYFYSLVPTHTRRTARDELSNLKGLSQRRSFITVHGIPRNRFHSADRVPDIFTGGGNGIVFAVTVLLQLS